MRKNLDIDGKDGHSCQYCDCELKEDEYKIVDNLIDLEKTSQKKQYHLWCRLLDMYKKVPVRSMIPLTIIRITIIL